MTNLLVLREQLKKFYSKYELYITPALKSLLALVTIIMINASIGYMSELKNVAVVLILALMCSFLPLNFIVVIAAAVTLGHLYKFSLECSTSSSNLCKPPINAKSITIQNTNAINASSTPARISLPQGAGKCPAQERPGV